MFPGANARIETNEDGEVTGWDYPSYDDEPDYYSGMDDWGYDGPENECPNEGCDDLLCDGSCEATEDDPWVPEDAWLDGSYEE